MVQQLSFLPDLDSNNILDRHIERQKDILIVPEGLDTIPYTHGIHRFPGKFIPDIPRYILHNILLREKERTIYDPFCGSGTALVEAAIDSRPFLGKDIDPLAVMIAKAKTTPIPETQLLELERFWQHHNFSREASDLIPAVPNLQHWFNEEALVQLSSIKAHCLGLPSLLSDFSMVVFSSIIRRVSNADDQTQKTYVSHTLPKKPPLPAAIFPVFLERAIVGMREYCKALPAAPRGHISIGDSRIDDLEIDCFDVLTSPPYIDSIDYVYNQLLEYFWLLAELGIHTYDRLRAFRKVPMGQRFSKYQGDEAFDFAPYLNTYSKRFHKVCKEIGKVNPREEKVVKSFFADFVMHISTIHKHQQKGCYYVCIVGNSQIRGVTVPTVDLVGEILKAYGYDLEDRFIYEIRRHYMKFPRRANSGKIKEDHVLVFRLVK